MSEESSNALVPVSGGRQVAARPGSPALRLGAHALALLARNPVMRRAALAGVAFGVGYQVSRALRSGGLPQLAGEARDVYRAINGNDTEVRGLLAGSWVRQSVTVISSVYGFLDREED